MIDVLNIYELQGTDTPKNITWICCEFSEECTFGLTDFSNKRL